MWFVSSRYRETDGVYINPGGFPGSAAEQARVTLSLETFLKQLSVSMLPREGRAFYWFTFMWGSSRCYVEFGQRYNQWDWVRCLEPHGLLWYICPKGKVCRDNYLLGGLS